MDYDVTVGEHAFSIRVVAAKGGGWTVSVAGDEARHFTGGPVGPAEWTLREGSRTVAMGLYADGETVHVSRDGNAWRVGVIDPRQAALAMGGTADVGAIITAMPGAVVRVTVAEGDTVRKGDPVMVVEAMKMENEFKAPCDGVIDRIYVVAGAAVDSGTLLASIVPAEVE